MLSLPFAIRQIAALLCAGTLAWDYFRDPDVVGNFPVWVLALHFVYFQLPLRSRALAYLHPVSFVGSCLVPIMYLVMCYWSPAVELQHMELWDVAWSTVLIRALLINAAPLLFHTLDITYNESNLVNSYKTKPKKVILLWSVFSFPALGFIFEILYPESEETSELNGISREDFLKQIKIVCFFALISSVTVLYLRILGRAFAQRQQHGTHHLGNSNNSSNSLNNLAGQGRDSHQNLHQSDNQNGRSQSHNHSHNHSQKDLRVHED